MTNENISAWLDGEHPARDPIDVQQLQVRKACGTWWLIGDILRQESALSQDFTARVMAVLDDEPTVLAPRSRPAEPVVQQPLPRWMALAAAVSGVAVVAWTVLGGQAAQQVAQNSAIAAAPQVQRPQALVSNATSAEEDERPYLVAHQAYGPGVQMAGVSGYVRPVAYEPLVAAR
ncbi:sigma-E factor negative regulatory protein [Uliginosibacterium sediminicola]|uniref:RseA family anti-sigma factor n=1 Tax=Uliginosibacterium sediminicola TaxID=2024550 RepID=A0ABU9YZM2_9RHOO